MKICPLCEKEIKENDTTQPFEDNREVHDGCYWDALSNLIEKHPIVNPTRMQSRPAEG